jgi:hypothetical protein
MAARRIATVDRDGVPAPAAPAPRPLGGLDPVARDMQRVLDSHRIEQIELEFRTPHAAIRDSAPGQHLLGPARDQARIVRRRLAGPGLERLADEDQRGDGRPRIHEARSEVRDQRHVPRLHRLDPQSRPIETDPALEDRWTEPGSGETHVVPLAPQAAGAEIHHLDPSITDEGLDVGQVLELQHGEAPDVARSAAAAPAALRGRCAYSMKRGVNVA